MLATVLTVASSLFAWGKTRLVQGLAGGAGASLPIAAILALVVAFVALGLVFLRRGPELPQMVLAAEVEAQRWQARAEALEHAVAKSNETLRLRASAVEALQAELADLRKTQEDARDATNDPNFICLPADDPWIRSKRLRQGARADGAKSARRGGNGPRALPGS